MTDARTLKAYLELGRGIAGVRFCPWPASSCDLGMAFGAADMKV